MDPGVCSKALIILNKYVEVLGLCAPDARRAHRLSVIGEERTRQNWFACTTTCNQSSLGCRGLGHIVQSTGNQRDYSEWFSAATATKYIFNKEGLLWHS